MGKVADAGADPWAACLVSIGCGMAFGGVNKVLGSAGSTSAMFRSGRERISTCASVDEELR